ncbi:hypothetical protein AB0G15_05950 [Streptosporangium sp. NPDC023825]|uniref:hypothetical protein n=1 Tax=Streptosporangium sp. NPDC023825 TaxID=3154909 RepID=UPI00343EE345
MKIKKPENVIRLLGSFVTGAAIMVGALLVFFGHIEEAVWLIVFSAFLLALVFLMDQNDQLKKENLIAQAENRAYLTKYGPVDW